MMELRGEVTTKHHKCLGQAYAATQFWHRPVCFEAWWVYSIPVRTYTNKPQERDDLTWCLQQAMGMGMELPPEDHYRAYAIAGGKSALAIRVLRQMCLGYFFLWSQTIVAGFTSDIHVLI
jgi:hypothetical protein